LPSRPSSIRDAIAAGAAILETALASSSVENGNPGGVLIPAEPGPWFQRRRYLLGNDKTIIGRGSDCEVRINHPNVSRHHLALEWIEGALVASHLSPLNPTLINGVPLSDARQLNAGDWVEIADGVRLRVELFEANDDVATERRAREERRLLAVLHADVVSYSTPPPRPDSSLEASTWRGRRFPAPAAGSKTSPATASWSCSTTPMPPSCRRSTGSAD
jgi:pSer/pThr/pTyr-binding forkhead associated (FHA) protein